MVPPSCSATVCELDQVRTSSRVIHGQSLDLNIREKPHAAVTPSVDQRPRHVSSHSTRPFAVATTGGRGSGTARCTSVNYGNRHVTAALQWQRARRTQACACRAWPRYGAQQDPTFRDCTWIMPYWIDRAASTQACSQRRQCSAQIRQCSCMLACFSHSSAQVPHAAAQACIVATMTCSLLPVRRAPTEPAARQRSAQSRFSRMHCLS